MQAAEAVRYALGEVQERPWGSWEVVAVGAAYVLKRVCVVPGGRISLQYHHHRTEYWTVVEGCAEVEIEGVLSRLEVGGRAEIPVLARHRIANPGTEPLVFVEIQMGPMLDEADIVRIADDYGRHAG